MKIRSNLSGLKHLWYIYSFKKNYYIYIFLILYDWIFDLKVTTDFTRPVIQDWPVRSGSKPSHVMFLFRGHLSTRLPSTTTVNPSNVQWARCDHQWPPVRLLSTHPSMYCCLFRTPVHASSFNDHCESLQMLLQSGGSCNSCDQQGTTPLMYAAMNGQSGAIGMWLLSNVVTQPNFDHSLDSTIFTHFIPYTEP